MKALNSKLVTKGYLFFSFGMTVCILMFVFMVWCLISTSKNEAVRIESRSQVFDNIFALQVNIVDRVDSLYNYITLINSDVRINNIVVQNVVSTKKMSLLNDLESLDDNDVLLYKRLMGSVNQFLWVKDSIRVLSSREETLKSDLQRCISADRSASRKLSLEGLQITNNSN